MKQLVIMPGGFHPFHAGHAALYQSAVEAFPGADVYVAATNDTSTRPFPFRVKEKLAQLAGVSKGRFMQVKSPFRAEEITAPYDPNTTQLIFVRSDKDAGSQPRPGGNKKDGSPSYLQPYDDSSDLPMSQRAYMAYLPTVEFGPGMTSATEIRGAWPQLNEKRKTALVMSLYPKTQTNPKLAATVVKLLDTAMGTVDESALDNLPRPNKRNQFKSLHKQRKQRGLDEGPLPEMSSKILSASDQNGVITIVVQAPDGTKRAVADPNPNYINRWLLKYGLTLPRSITNKFVGVTENTAPNPRVDLTPNYPNYATLVGEFVGIKKNRALFRILAAELRPGQGETEKIFRAMSTNTPIGIEIGKVKNRAVLENVDKEFILYIDGKPAAKYMDQQQAVLDMAAVRKKYPAARLELKHEVYSAQPVKQVNEGGSILEVLKPDAFKTLQQAKQNIEQNRQQEVDQWAQDFRANSAKLAGQQLKRAVNPPPVPVARPGEKHAVLQNRISQLDQAINKQQQLDALTQKLEHKGLLTPAMQMDFDTRMYVRDAAADDYQALNQKLDRAIVLATNRLRTNKLAFKEDPDYIEEGRKI